MLDNKATLQSGRSTSLSAEWTLFALMLLSYVLPAGPFTAVIAALCLLLATLSPGDVNRNAFKLAAPFLVMMLYGVAMSGGNESYDVGKDIWYISKLCLCLILGFQLGMRTRDGERTLRFLVLFAVLTSLWSIALYLSYGYEIADPVTGDQTATSRIPLLGLIAIPFLLEHLRRSESRHFPAIIGALGVIGVAIILSNSRTTVLIALGLVATWAGLLASWRRAIFAVALAVAVGFAIWPFLPAYTGGDLTITVKWRRSIEELLFTDSFDARQMLLNWRGFEAYNAQLKFNHSNIINKIFGSGAGATVDLGQSVDMGMGMNYRFIPILHNGFYYILIKYGLLGIAIYTVSILKFINWGRVGLTNSHNFYDRLLRGIVLSIFLSTTVITGLFNKTELHGITIMTAWLVAYLYKEKRTMLFDGRPSSVQANQETVPA